MICNTIETVSYGNSLSNIIVVQQKTEKWKPMTILTPKNPSININLARHRLSTFKTDHIAFF